MKNSKPKKRITLLYFFCCFLLFSSFSQDPNPNPVSTGEFFNQNSRIILRVYNGFMGGPEEFELEKYSINLPDYPPELIYFKLRQRSGSIFIAESLDNTYQIRLKGNVNDEKMFIGDLELTGPNGTESFSSADLSQDSFSEANFNQKNQLVILILLGFLFLISFVVLSWYLKKIYNQLYSITENTMYNHGEYYPMVRISRRSFFWRHRIIILYKDSIVALKKWRWKSIAALHEEDSRNLFSTYKERSKKFIYYIKKNGTSQDIFKARDIAFEDVRQVILCPRRITRTHLLKFKTKSGTFKLVLPDYECNEFIKALAEILPGKVRYAYINLVLRSLVGIIVTGLVLFMIYLSTTMILWWEQGLIWIVLLTLFCILPIIFIKYDLYKKGNTAKQKKTYKDLSHRKPIRSNTIALALRFLAVVSLGLYFYNQFIPWNYEAMLIGSALLISIAVSQKKTDKLREKDKRKPILYLRSFLDDNETTLNPCTSMSTILGIDPPYYVLTGYGLEEGLRYRIGKIIIKYGYSFWPSRLIRLFFGNPLDTSEEQLTNYFKRYGLVVAIGKPGEKITTLGASRIYVTNDEWQQTVIDLLNESQIILLQPSTTNGVWWEIDKVFKNCEPENIILCMVNYRKHQEYYETFFRKLKKIKPDIKIPRSIGNDKRISFITFGLDWQPNIIELKYYSKFRWLFTGNALNLKDTFKNYINKRNMLQKYIDRQG